MIRQSRGGVSRRRVVKQILAGGAVAATAPALLAQTTTSTAPATTQADAITPEELAIADRVEGRSYTEAERKMMAGGMNENRAKLRALRARHIEATVEPAVQFNPRVARVAIPTGPSSFSLSEGTLIDYNGKPESLAFASAAELSRLIHARKITSTALTKMYLDRLKRLGPKLNMVVNLTEELALKQAKRADEELAAGKDRGPLHGLPWGAKDLLATKGYPTTFGVKPFADQMLDYDATVVTKLEDAGAVLLAKLSLGELAMGDVWYGGKTRSPWKPASGSSGSSAGPAAATAAGCVAFSIGSETMGSIISPCITNALTGLRPTYGRISRYGAMALSRTMDKIGPITRGVEDCAMVLSAIHGADGLDPTAVGDVGFRWSGKPEAKRLRVGFDPNAFEQIKKAKSEQRRSAYADALAKVKELVGSELTPITLPPVSKFAGIAGMIIAVESASSFTELVVSGKVRELVQQDGGSWPNTFRIGSTIPASDYLRAMQVRTMLQREMAEALKDVDCYVTIPYSGPTMAYTNLTGHPTLVTRCGIVDEMPVLIEIVGNLYREDAILELGLAYERATDWTGKWPDTGKIEDKE